MTVEKRMPPAVLELKKRLQDQYPGRLARCVLFGSRARGDHAPDSDIDVLVTLRGPVDGKTEKDIWSLAYALDLEFEVLLDVQVLSEEDLQNRILGAIPLMENVEKDGVPV